MDVGNRIEYAVSELEPGGHVAQMRRLTGGVSAHVFGLEIETRKGSRRRVVFRQHRPVDFKGRSDQVARLEFGVLAALYSRGFPVPEPYLVSSGGSMNTPFLVMEWIDGSTDVAEADLPQALHQMAQFLAALHSLDPADLSVPEIGAIEDPVSTVARYLPSTDAGDLVRTVLAADRHSYQPSQLALLHGDFWPGNIVWQQRRLAAVIDWEDACMGEPLVDLAAVRVELLCRYGPDSMERFTSCYLAIANDAKLTLQLDRLPLWEVYVSASALSTMAQWGLEPGEEARRRRRTEAFFERAASAL